MVLVGLTLFLIESTKVNGGGDEQVRVTPDFRTSTRAVTGSW